VKRRQATALLKGQRTRGSVAARQERRARLEPPEKVIQQNTPLPVRQMKDAWAERNQEPREKQRGAGETLRTSTGTVVRSGAIRQKIIGHGFTAADGGFGCGRLPWAEDRQLTLANQPSRQIGGGVLVQPLIEKRGYLLAQIGGMAEAREFIALQGIARSSEKKLPRRLGARSGQDGLLSGELSTGVNNHTSISLLMTSNLNITPLWKSVENSENSWKACSACAGDYEDPDRTAWVEIEEECDDEEDQRDPEEN
jgi:hypothetical protein